MEKIQAMKRAAKHVDCILETRLPKWLRAGITEKQLFEKICNAICVKNFSLAFPPIVAFGAGGAEPHHEPTNIELCISDSILIDCGAVFEGWCSDCTRMFSLGNPDSFFSEKFSKLFSVHAAALKLFLPGTECSKLDASVRTKLKEDAALFIHTLGHGVGKEVHVPPRIGSNSSEILRVGDVLTCEPGIYFQGKFGIRIEDQLVVQEGSRPEIITTCPRELCVVDAWGKTTYQK